MVQNSSPMAKLPRHIIAEASGPLPAWSPDLLGWRRLVEFLGDDAEAFSAWCAHGEHLRNHRGDRPTVPTPAAAQSLIHPDHLDAGQRKQRVADLTAAMIASSDPAEREGYIGSIRRLVDDPEQRRLKRRLLLRRIHSKHHGEMADYAAAEVIARELSRRFGTSIISTGNKDLDAVIDEVLLYCARPGSQRSIPSARSIRRDLAPG